jgi:hypothetical protein
MRYLILTAAVFIVFTSCSKDKFTTAPQIKFISITNAIYGGGLASQTAPPILTIEVTDAEGDLGFSDTDSSYIYVKNITVLPNPIDSFRFPVSLPQKKKFKGDVAVDISAQAGGLGGVLSANCGSGCTDTLYFEVYVKDFAKNKSNVIRTDKPLYFIHP